MISNVKNLWCWLTRRRPPIAAAPTPRPACCHECLTSDGQALADRLTHLVREHLDTEERWLLKLLLNNYHLNDLCAILGSGPDRVRYRVAALRSKMLVLLKHQHADDCLRRSLHRLISGPWF